MKAEIKRKKKEASNKGIEEQNEESKDGLHRRKKEIGKKNKTERKT